MSTTKSTQGSSPRTEVYSPRSDLSIEEEGEGANEGTATRMMMISTPGSSRGVTPRTNLSSTQVSEEQKEPTTGELSSTVSSELRARATGSEKNSSSSTTDSSKKTISLGEVLEEHTSSLITEELELEEEMNDGKFLAQNLETMLDALEIFDSQEREEFRSRLSHEPESSEALQAVEKVANVAQSSLKRLQRVVKEKDDLIVALQEAVASAYQESMSQQERDHRGLEQLHNMFLSREGLTFLDVKDSLKQLEGADGLAGQIAKLFDQYLHELSTQHEDHNKALEIDLATWKSRCEELETSLQHERQHWQSHLSTKLTETVLDWEQAKTELQTTHAMVEKLKEHLDQKDEQLRMYRESVEALESMLEEEKERQTELASGYEQITKDTRQTLGKVSAVKKQLRMLKNDASKYQFQGHTNDLEVKDLQKKLEQQNSLNHKLGVELAALRRRSLSMKSKGNECKGCVHLGEWQKQAQLFQGCIPPLVAQVLELKDQLHIRSASEVVQSMEKHVTDLDLSCSPQFVPTSDKITTDSKGICPHEFVPLGNLSDRREKGEMDAHLISHQLRSPKSPRTQVKDTLKVVESETITKLEGHAKLTKKMELVQRKLDNCKHALERSEIDLSRSGATVEHLKCELRKSQEKNRELEEKLQNRVESKKKHPTDCMRIKGLLDNIEKLEMEATLLKHEVMVEKDRHIARLERELRKTRHRPAITIDNKMKSDMEGNQEKKILDMESALVSKDSLILELKFEVDQATWKLDQVEKRFEILFGALECKKMDLDSPIADSMLESIFSSKKMNSPALTLLKEKVRARRGHFRDGSREKELEGLVEDLLKVVEKIGYDNEMLSRTCEDTVKHMVHNQKLRKVVEDLQGQIAGGRQSPGKSRPNSAQAALITDLKSQISDLTDANAGLLRALRETEDQCSGLKRMVQEHFLDHNPSIPHEDKERFRKSRRICFSKEEHKKQDKRLKDQADKINKLEQQVATQNQFINDQTKELERKDNELDLVHGKLSIKMLSEQSENIQQSKKDLWSSAIKNTRNQGDANQLAEDVVDNEYLMEHENELVQAENRRLRKFVTALKNPELLDEIRDLKSDYQRMDKVCDRYEDLLRVYSRQVGVPFSSLREPL